MRREPNIGRGRDWGCPWLLSQSFAPEVLPLFAWLFLLETGWWLGEGLGPPLSCLVLHGTQELPSL